MHFLERHILISQASIKAVEKTFSKEKLSPVITCQHLSKLSKMYFPSKGYLTWVQSSKCWFNYLFGLDRCWALVSTLSQFYWSLIYKVLVMMNMSITEKTWTDIYTPCTTKLWWVYWFHSICLSCMPCLLWGSLHISGIIFIFGANTTHEEMMCCKAFPGQLVKGQGHTGHLNFCGWVWVS